MADKLIRFRRRSEGASPSKPASCFRVLVINDSTTMAKEMRLQLELAVPNCQVTFSPSIQLAQMLLNTSAFELIISSPVLPDGSAATLTESLHSHDKPPPVVIVGSVPAPSVHNFEQVGYHLSTVSRRSREVLKESQSQQMPLPLSPLPNQRLKLLGEDIRNDLNNPLQEIVTMVFLARSDEQRADLTEQALEAIQKAATNMAEYVRAIEGRILEVVHDPNPQYSQDFVARGFRV